MRSLLISASILVIGGLAALPFRKDQIQTTQRSPQERLPAYQSPLQEMGGIAGDELAELETLTDLSRPPVTASAMDPVIQAQPLPTSHNPISSGLIDPSEALRQEIPQPSTEEPQVAVWKPVGPVAGGTPDYVSEPAPETIVHSGPSTPVDLLTNEETDLASSDQDPSAMEMTWARLRQESTQGTPAPESSIVQPRKRFFIYEPAD